MVRAGLQDAPTPWVLVAIALVCAGAGYVLARASLDVDRAALAEGSPSSEPESHAAVPVDRPLAGLAGEGAPLDAGSPPAAEIPTEAAIAEDVPADAEAIAEPQSAQTAQETQPATGGSGPTTITLGRIAYIRCDQAAGTPGGACPRDLAVERRVNQALESLPSCPALAGKTGIGDVRVVFASGQVSGLGFRDLGTEGVDRDAVRVCLEPRLGALRTSLPMTRMTVAFQFELRR